MKKGLIFAVILLLMLLPTCGLALTAELSAERTSVECGDTVTVDITYRDAAVGAVRAAFSYDSTILEYVGGEGSTAANGTGTVVLLTESASATMLHTTLTFRAVCAGRTELDLVTKEALSFDEQPLELPAQQLLLTVQKAADSYVVVTAGGVTMHALCTPPYLPAGCTEKQITVAGKTLTAAYAGDAEYVYLTKPEETTGGFYLRKEGEYFPAIELNQKAVVIPFSNIPDGWEKTTLQNLEAITDGTEYRVNTLLEDGTERVCTIDPDTLVLQSTQEQTITLSQTVVQRESYDFTLLYILGGVLAALTLAIVVAAVLKKRNSMYKL